MFIVTVMNARLNVYCYSVHSPSFL